MSSGADNFLKKALGEDFMESLSKFELWKPGTKTTIDHEELRTALQIVPRTIIAMLIKELAPMAIDESKEVPLFVGSNAVMQVKKHERDVYSGEIFQDNKKVVDFKFRSLPGVGLIIMSAFELYDMDNLINSPEKNTKAPMSEDISSKVQRMIDERLALHDLIGKVVDKKVMEREAVHAMMLARLTAAVEEARPKGKPPEAPQSRPPEQVPEPITVASSVVKAEPEKKVKSPVAAFLEARKNKKGEYSVHMAKGETVDCPDCGKNIFDGRIFSGCVCLGDDMERKVFIKKSEDGIKVRFGKGWDQENIEMLLEVMRNKNG